jgi:hypothetical protein
MKSGRSSTGTWTAGRARLRSRGAAPLGDNVSWHTPGRGPLAGDVVGREAVFARLGRYVAETGGAFRAELKRVLTDEDGRVIGAAIDAPPTVCLKRERVSCSLVRRSSMVAPKETG